MTFVLEKILKTCCNFRQTFCGYLCIQETVLFRENRRSSVSFRSGNKFGPFEPDRLTLIKGEKFTSKVVFLLLD